MERLADQIPPLGRHMVIHLAEDHDQLALDVLYAVQRVIVLALAESLGMDVSSKVADCSSNALVECSAEGKMASKTHASGANASVASLQADQDIDRKCGIFIVS